MKRIISGCITTTLIAVMLVSNASSQELSVNTKKEQKALFGSEKTGQPSDIQYINDVNRKVLNSFYRSFGDKPDTKWSKTGNGYVASFKSNNRNTYVYFSNNGAIQYTNHYYSEDQLPKDVRHTVRSNFYDYSIIHVTEVRKDDFVCFLVKVQDKSSVKTIKVVGEEWEIVEEMQRQSR